MKVWILFLHATFRIHIWKLYIGYSVRKTYLFVSIWSNFHSIISRLRSSKVRPKAVWYSLIIKFSTWVLNSDRSACTQALRLKRLPVWPWSLCDAFLSFFLPDLFFLDFLLRLRLRHLGLSYLMEVPVREKKNCKTVQRLDNFLQDFEDPIGLKMNVENWN